MTLEEYINGLNELVKENPEAKDSDVIHYEYQIGKYVKICGASFGHLFKDQETFFDKEEFNEWKEEMGDSEDELNAVCIN